MIRSISSLLMVLCFAWSALAQDAELPATTAQGLEHAPPEAAPAEEVAAAKGPPQQAAPARAQEDESSARLRVIGLRITTAERELDRLSMESERVSARGLRCGRAIAWGLAGTLALYSVIALSDVRDIERQTEAGQYSDDGDTDGDGDVDRDDARRPRRASRILGGLSASAAAAGVVTTVFYRLRLAKLRALYQKVEHHERERMRAIHELDYELRANHQGAHLGLILRM